MKLQPQKIVRRGRFVTRQGLVIDDLPDYVSKWLEENQDYDISVHVGCDSHVGERQVKYVTSLCLRKEGKGGHIVTKDDFAEKGMDLHERLFNEVVLALEAAQTLKVLGLDITIHVDYNSVDAPKNKSHELYAAGIGTGAWFGYKTVGKPDAWCASKAADHYTRTSRPNRKYFKQRRKDRNAAA